MAENRWVKKDGNTILFRAKWFGQLKLAWMPFGIWAFVCERTDYGSVVIAVWRFWIAWNDPWWRKWADETDCGRKPRP